MHLQVFFHPSNQISKLVDKLHKSRAKNECIGYFNFSQSHSSSTLTNKSNQHSNRNKTPYRPQMQLQACSQWSKKKIHNLHKITGKIKFSIIWISLWSLTLLEMKHFIIPKCNYTHFPTKTHNITTNYTNTSLKWIKWFIYELN